MRYGIAIVPLFSVFLPAVAGESAVSVLRDKLQQRGVEVGVHGTQYVSLGDFEMEIADPVADQAFVVKRDRCSICAEILAKRALLQARQMMVAATGRTQLETQTRTAKDEAAESSDFLAKMALRDAEVFDSAECWNPQTGKFQIAVAVSWNARREKTGVELPADGSHARNGEGGPGEWEKWAKRVDLATVSGTRKFVDSDGVSRHVGIGCADVEGLETSSPWMRMAQDSALVRARANLSLALYAETLSEDKLFQLYAELLDDGAKSSTSFESRVGKVTRQSNKLTAFAPEVYSAFVVHPVTKRKMFVSVCGYEPRQLAELGIIDWKMLQRSWIETPAQKPAAENSGVMIFNPNTGKFETKE